jgi:hypothetical protein
MRSVDFHEAEWKDDRNPEARRTEIRIPCPERTWNTDIEVLKVAVRPQAISLRFRIRGAEPPERFHGLERIAIRRLAADPTDQAAFEMGEIHPPRDRAFA